MEATCRLMLVLLLVLIVKIRKLLVANAEKRIVKKQTQQAEHVLGAVIMVYIDKEHGIPAEAVDVA